MSRSVRRLEELFQVEAAELEDVFRTYIQETGSALAEARAAIDRGEYGAVSKLGHGIKGSSSNLRLMGLTAAAYFLETAAKAADIAATETAHGQLMSELEILKEEITKFYG